MNSANQMTIYKKGNTELKYSANFKAFPIMKAKTNSDFIVKKSIKNHFVIWQIPHVNDYLSPLKSGRISIFNSNLNNNKVIGIGNSPIIQTPSNILTFIDSDNNSIEILKVRESLKVATIKLNSRRAYFIPTVTVLNNSVLYSDINDKGEIGLIFLDLVTKKRKILHKPNRLSTYFESCYLNGKFYILESSAEQSFTSIYSLDPKEIDFSKRTIITSTSNGPSHHLQCSREDNSLYFVSQFKGKTRVNSEVAQINLQTKSLNVRSDLKFVTSIGMLDNQIIIPFRKKIYLLKNKQDEFLIGNTAEAGK